jgi:perosamine synthetase
MIPHNRPTFGEEEQSACQRVMESSWLAQGPEVAKFEDEFCEFLNLPAGHSVAVSSGTASLYLALNALEASGKSVAFPVYVCSAVRNAVRFMASTENIIDTEENSPNINFKKASTSGSNLIIVPHMFGIPTRFENLNGIKIIEDCAQALGSRQENKFTGLRGELGIFSFYATKLISTGGQGGMIISTNKYHIDGIKDYREFDSRRDHKTRFNFQMTDLQAAIGREQLKKLPSFLSKREEIFDKYKSIDLPLVDLEDDLGSTKAVRYRAVIRSSNAKIIQSKLLENNIKSIVPIEDWELLGDKNEYPYAANFSDTTLSLPIYPSLDLKDVENIVKIVNNTI